MTSVSGSVSASSRRVVRSRFRRRPRQRGDSAHRLRGAGMILGRGPRVGLVPRPTRIGYRLQRLWRWGVDGRECGFLRRGSPRGVLVLVLVLEPMGSGDGVEGLAWLFEYEYRPSGWVRVRVRARGTTPRLERCGAPADDSPRRQPWDGVHDRQRAPDGATDDEWLLRGHDESCRPAGAFFVQLRIPRLTPWANVFRPFGPWGGER